ncbi:MAG: hypothetical protein CM15mP83_4020 [Flavobacteriaceae bacterium]|nr:MAG: hypothetical protein CM15mP83_4020 [Flavobacteriaceae bacterium]
MVHLFGVFRPCFHWSCQRLLDWTYTGRKHAFFKSHLWKAVVFALLSIGLIFFIQFPKVKIYKRYSSIFYLIIIALLLGLLFWKEVSGAQSWYSFGGFSFQPAEFAKVVTALALTKHLSEINTDLTKISDQLTSFLLIFLPALIILPQPDPGSTVVFLSFLLVLHTEKFPLNFCFLYWTCCFVHHYFAAR